VVLTIGENELNNKQVQFKVMSTGKEQTLSLAEIYADFDKVYKTQTADMTAFNEFFGKED